MSYSIIDRLKWENRKVGSLKKQEQLRQEKYQKEHKPDDTNHILSCDMRDAYKKVHADPRVYNNKMWLDPNKKYKS